MEPLEVDEKTTKEPNSQILEPVLLFEAGLIRSYIILQDLYIQECQLQQKAQGM